LLNKEEAIEEFVDKSIAASVSMLKINRAAWNWTLMSRADDVESEEVPILASFPTLNRS